MFTRSAVIVLLGALGLTAGCARVYQMDRTEMNTGRSWAASHGHISNIGASETGAFRGDLKLLWERRVSGKPAGPISLYNNVLVYPETKKKIRFYDAVTGSVEGRIKVKGLPQTGVVVSDSMAFYGLGPRKNYIKAFNIVKARSAWTRRLKDAADGPIVVDNRLIVSSGEGRLQAFSLGEGERLWQYEMEGRFQASASAADGRLWQANDRGELSAVSVEDGTELYRVKLQSAVVSPVAVADKVYATDVLGNVYALEPGDGSVIWQRELDLPVWTTPAVAHGRLYIGHSNGGVVALESADGRETWRYDIDGVVRASPVVIGQFVVFGTMSGKLVVLNAADGSVRDSTQVEGAIRYSPATDGSRLYVTTQSGRILCFGEHHEPSRRADHGVSP